VEKAEPKEEEQTACFVGVNKLNGFSFQF